MERTKKIKILIVDDEPENIKTIFSLLNCEIYRVFIAYNGKVAIEQAQKHLPDAIIMDWEMPVMNGMQAIGIIRNTEEIKNTPIIVATGKMTSVENLRIALETGANDYIRKPFDPIEIEARIKSMIRLREVQEKTLLLEKEIMEHKFNAMKREMDINLQAFAASKMRLIYLSKKNEELIKDLENFHAFISEQNRTSISNMISELKTNINSYNWKEFEYHFEKVHPNFFANLKKYSPEISANELELCVFIKLNMTNKEITSVTFKSSEALKKAKQRLKSKLGLNTEEDLFNFISNIE